MRLARQAKVPARKQASFLLPSCYLAIISTQQSPIPFNRKHTHREREREKGKRTPTYKTTYPPLTSSAPVSSSRLVSLSKSIGSPLPTEPIPTPAVSTLTGASPHPQSYSSERWAQSKMGFFNRSFTLLCRAHSL